MCFPGAEIVVGAATQVLGAAMSASSQVDMSAYNAAVANNNIILARQQQEVERRRISDEKARALATQRVATGKSGLRSKGSPAALLEDTMMRFGYQQALNAHDFQVKRQQIGQGLARSQFESKAARSRQRADMFAGVLGGVGQLSGLLGGTG